MRCYLGIRSRQAGVFPLSREGESRESRLRCNACSCGRSFKSEYSIIFGESGRLWFRCRLVGCFAGLRDNLGKLVFGKQVTIEYDERDQYGRIVGKVLIAGDDANLEQIEAGLAWHYKAYEDEQSVLDRQIYALTEVQAHRGRVGLWRDANPVPPPGSGVNAALPAPACAPVAS